MSGLVWGLCGATLIGVSDCVARVTASRISLSVLIAFIMIPPFAVMTVWFTASGGWPAWNAWGWGASAGSGLLNVVVLALLFRALVRGPVTVASPATSSFTVMLVGLNVLAGHPYHWLHGVAALTVFGGVAMLAQPERAGKERYDRAWLRVTALLGLGAAVSVALRMFLAQEAGAALGTVPAVYLNRAFALAGALSFMALERQRRPLAWPRGTTWPLVFFQAVLETVALGLFLTGSAGGERVGAAIGFSCFAAVTAVTARIWLGDRIGFRRLCWMAVVAAGVAVAALV